MAGKSRFSEVELAPPDAIFNVLARFKDDKDPQKVNLSVGGELPLRFDGRQKCCHGKAKRSGNCLYCLTRSAIIKSFPPLFAFSIEAVH